MSPQVLHHGGASPELDPPPDSWELLDLDSRMKNLLSPPDAHARFQNVAACFPPSASMETAAASTSVDVESVDSFLREALQGRDRLTILRLEQEVDRFMRNSKLQQLEFQPMPSSYLRLVAHRVAQHYNLQSSAVDANSPEGTRIIARKTAESRFPKLRLADIPANIESEGRPVHVTQHKVEIKRRSFKGSKFHGDFNGSGDLSSRLNPSKSVEERKDEYNKARARIFSFNDLAGAVVEEETVALETSQSLESFSNNISRVDKELVPPCETIPRFELNDGPSRILYGKTEGDSAVKHKGNTNRVAIFRDREKDRKDPDYDRSYDRYMQRFDPGFGVSLGPFAMQAMYTPVVNYNTEFPQLGGGATRPQICVEPPVPRASQSMQGPWAGSSNPVGYGHPDPMMGSFNPGHVGPHPGSGVYMHPPQFTCPRPNMTYICPQEQFQQPSSQPEGSFSQARRH